MYLYDVGLGMIVISSSAYSYMVLTGSARASLSWVMSTSSMETSSSSATSETSSSTTTAVTGRENVALTPRYITCR